MCEIIKAVNLTKKFKNIIAVDNINFHLNKGEIFGFLGPNGAGKTTTINMFIGMAKISSGNIYYNNEDLTKNIKKAQEFIGVVADDSNLYDEMSGYENLCFCGSLYGIKKNEREQRATELLDIFNLTDAAQRKFRTYSKGMKRKLTIAAALMHKPQILFLDEPTTGIDISSVRQIRELIKKLNNNGTTIFLTTHYIEEAERLCNRIAFINKGKIVKIDTVDNLLNQTEQKNIIEVAFITEENEKKLLNAIKQEFTNFESSLKSQNTINIISSEKIDISPVVRFLSERNVFVTEARIVKPTLEDVFVTATGIGIDLMKNEKEKK